MDVVVSRLECHGGHFVLPFVGKSEEVDKLRLKLKTGFSIPEKDFSGHSNFFNVIPAEAGIQ